MSRFRSASALVTFYAGDDAPNPPRGLRLALALVVLSWLVPIAVFLVLTR